MTTPIIVFDLDGTLVDTAPDLLDSLNHCLIHAGLESAAPEALRKYVGHGGRVMITRAFEAQDKRPSEANLDELQRIFLEHYSAGIPGKSKPYPGALDAVKRFLDAGFTAAVCTNKYEALSVALIEGLGISGHFSAICGADTFAFRKPDPRHLHETIRVAGGNSDRAVMIGDSRTDIDTAKAAGIPVVAVDWGYTDRHVSEFGPSKVISHYDELTTDLVDRLLAQAV